MEDKLGIRTDVLGCFGANGKLANELLSYNENRFQRAAVNLSHFPLPDESFVAAWREYARATEEECTIDALGKYLVQFRFPIQAAISESEEYLAATRRGMDTNGMKLAVGLSLRNPRQCRLTIHSTAAGCVPILTAQERDDFVTLVQALTHRNEPHFVPESMGACMVAGFNNWHRIFRLRDCFMATASPDDSWIEEFKRIKSQKELYQDRFIILSTGPYSAVNASDVGFDEEEWLSISLVIRREHECTHYFTQRVFSSMRNNLLDELIADFMGITTAIGRFRSDWLLRFMGLESFPSYRNRGRLQNYRGEPPLSDAAFAILQKMVVAAAANLEDFDRHHALDFQCLQIRAAMLLMLTALSVEEMAARNANRIMDAAFVHALQVLESQRVSRDTGPNADRIATATTEWYIADAGSKAIDKE